MTDQPAETVAFHTRLLGLEQRQSASSPLGRIGAGLCDPTGRPTVHLAQRSSHAEFAQGHEPGWPTAALHHVAFKA